MAGINPYMIPSQYMPEDTYVSQHVPLPLEALDNALQTRKSNVDDPRAAMDEFSQKEIGRAHV